MTGLRRYANKRDANEPIIIDALEAMGCLVCPMNKPVDLLVRIPRRGLFLVEVKTKTGRLTAGQKAFAELWPIHVIRSVDEAIAFVRSRSRPDTQEEAA